MIDWQPLDALLANVRRAVLTTHVRPDGDALGSELGFRALLRSRGDSVTIVNPSVTPERYRFLDPDREILSVDAGTDPASFAPDLVAVLDTGAWSQLPGMETFLRTTPAKKIVIDHHRTQDDLGATRFVDVEAAACGMLVRDACRAFKAPIDAAAATALFAAIATDTGWLRHPNASAQVFAALGALAACGADAADIHCRLYETNSLGRLRLLGRMLQSLALDADGRLAFAQVSHADIVAAGAHPMDTEGFVGHLTTIEGVEAALLLIEQEGGQSKASVRSKGEVDCSKLAERWGGGGHRAAAGATVPWPLAEAAVRLRADLAAALPPAGR